MGTTHDVIIIGARCAGAATAMLLARHGLRVLVLDRSRYGSDTISTHALMRGGVVQLQRWGLLDRVVAAGTPPVTKVVFHYPDDVARVSLKPAAGVDALYAPRRNVLDPLLTDAAVEAGAEILFGVTVIQLLRDDSGRVTGVVGRDRNGRRTVATAPLTIGADGIRSFVAGEVGAAVIRTAAGLGSAFLYGYWDGLPVEGYEWLYGPSASGGLIPTNDGRTGVFVGTTPARMKQILRARASHGPFSALLEHLSPAVAERVRAARGPEGRRGFAGLPGYVRQSWGPGWALVGDAGSFEDPLSTHGITDALREAELLATAVVEMHGGAISESAALAGYQRTRDALSARLYAAVEAIASYEWTMPRLRQLLLEASSAMTEQMEILQRLDQDRGLAHATAS
ncbi:MAG TPA: NAD(P)/FAD-dependent oxidoreductase [Jiangellaceae bacterium]